MDWKIIGGLVVDAAKELLPAIVPGAGPAIAAGEKLADALDSIIDIDGVPDAPETRDQLRDRVNKALDDAINKLG